MSRRERFKQGFKDFTGEVTGLFKRKGADKGTSSSSTPSVTPPHTIVPLGTGRVGSHEAVVPGPGPVLPTQASVISPTVKANSNSIVDDYSGPLPRSTVQITGDDPVVRQPSPSPPEVSSQAVGPNLGVLTEQPVSRSQALGHLDANVLVSHPQSAESDRIKQPGQNVIQQHSGESSTRPDIKTLAKGVAKSAANVLKVGPLQDIFDLLGALGDTYKMEGDADKEYETLQTRLQTVLDRLENEFGEGSPSKLTGMDRLRKSIEAELVVIKNKRARSQHARYLEAHKEADEIQACYRRIAGYWEQLTLDTNQAILTMAEEQSKARIDRLPSAPSARYDSSTGQDLKRRECTPGTRIEVLANLISWGRDGNKGGVYWLNGMAGTGKTTIAYSVCKELDKNSNLAASFFCSRQRQECRDVNMIIPSIAHQLAQLFPPFRSALSTILGKDQDAHTRRLDIQFKALIEEPMLSAKPLLPKGLVVVIDALDECENEESTRDILEVLLAKSEDVPVRFIVSSRPEQQVRDKMTDDRVQSKLVLHELDTGEVQTDIATYLKKELEPMRPPPTDTQIGALVERAGVLFIYAATAVRYIGYKNFGQNAVARLQTILDGSRTGRTKHYEEVDLLYALVLKAALGDQGLDEDERDDMQQVLHTVICAREPLAVQSLSRLLQMNDVGRVRAAIQPLYSVLHVVGDTELVTTLHASFPDFMFDSTRSKKYWCDSNIHNRKLAEHCFEYITQTQPEFNICGLESSYLPDKEVSDIDGRVANAISPELLYACRYWAEHVEAAKCASSILDQLQVFLSTRLLLWMEVLNLKNQMNAGTWCMKLMGGWYKALQAQEELMELASDARRFVDMFAANPVSQSTPHIYVSMLAFWPKFAPITKYYAKYTRGPVEAEGTALDRRQLAHLSTWKFERGIRAMVVSADGLYLGLADGNDVLVVDSSSGRVILGPLQGLPNEIRSVAFSPDGSRILAGSSNDEETSVTVLGWDTRTGVVALGPLHLHGHTESIKCLSFSPDCSCIATGSEDKTVRLWDTGTGKMLHQLDAHDAVWAVAFSPDGTEIAGGANKTLHPWDIRTGKPTHTTLTHTDYFGAIAYSSDQSFLISASQNSKDIFVWNALSGEAIRTIEGHTGVITCIGYSPDGRYIVSGSVDGTVHVWDVQTSNNVLGPLKGDAGAVTSVTFSPDGSRIISACTDGLICTWDALQRNLAPSSTAAPFDSITCVKFSSDGMRFVSGSQEGAISIYRAHTGEMVLGPVKVHTSGINVVDFKSDRVVSGSEDGKICVCDARNGEVMLGPLEVDSEPIRAIAYSPGGELIATWSCAGVDVWSAQDGRRILGPLTDLHGDVRSVQFSPDGTRIVASSGRLSSNVVVWDVSDGRNVFGTLDGHSDYVRSVSYSPNGALIASGSDDKTIIIWDADTGKKKLRPLTGHSDWVRSVSFSPDSARLVSGSDDSTILIWDVQTGEMMFELLHGHEHWIASVEYSPDGTCIMSRSDDGSVRIHDAQSPEERAQLRYETEIGDWTINKDGWVVDDQSRLLVWVPGDLRKALMLSETRVVIGPEGYVRLKFDKSRMGESWAQNYTSLD